MFTRTHHLALVRNAFVFGLRTPENHAVRGVTGFKYYYRYYLTRFDNLLGKHHVRTTELKRTAGHQRSSDQILTFLQLILHFDQTS